MENQKTKKTRILSGMRATGKLHLGNYFGAAKGMVALQSRKDYETFYMVADLHALTTPFSPKTLSQYRRNVMVDYLAIGLDPQRSTIFFQSMVPEHIELAYYLSTLVSVARMQHLPTFKEKVKQYPENVTLALLNYPVLMAADILIYQADLVPVGIDQEPHLEVSREIVRKLNQIYQLHLPQPRRFKTSGDYVPSLNGIGKMSKSVPGSFIALDDSLAVINQKIAKVPTDSGRGQIQLTQVDKKAGFQVTKRYFDARTNQESVGVGALMKLVELFMGEAKRAAFEHQYQAETLSYNQLKSQLAQAIFAEIEPIQRKKQSLLTQPNYLDEVIAHGAEKARAQAQITLKLVKKAFGLLN